MIIDKYKTIFIHIPKNAGTAIKDFFNKDWDNGLHIPRTKIHKHDTIHQIKLKSPELYDSFKKFAVVRNPYDRMLSWYAYLKRAMKIEHTLGDHRWKSGEHFPSGFIEWVKDPFENYYSRWKLSDVRNGRENSTPFLSPQHTWVDDTVEIIKYENLNKELSEFFKKEISLPVVNKSNHDDYLKHYDKESLDIVYNRYKKDFKEFNYKKL